jgi:DNA-directed RNA polymerase alpha subunit
MREEFSFVYKGTTICFVQLYGDCWICSLPSFVANQLKKKVSTLTELSIDELELPVRMSNVLKAANMMTVYDVMERNENYIRRLPNCGETSIKALKAALLNIGLELRR